MSVSVSQTQSNVDLDAIVSGGEAFTARLKALQGAKAQHDEALKKLSLGTDVVRAMQDVQAREQAALDAITQAHAQVEKMIADARMEVEAMLGAARDEASAIRTKAAAEGDALAREVDEAHAALSEWSNRTRQEANELMNEAVAARQAADTRAKQADQMAADAAAAMARAKASHDEANKRHASLTQWREAITSPPT